MTLINSGTDTSILDAYREGSEITSEQQRFKRIRPVLIADADNNIVKWNVFGQSQDFYSSGTFSDREKFSATNSLISGSTLSSALANKTVTDNMLSTDGIVEILINRNRLDLLSKNIDRLFPSHDVYGTLIDGNEDDHKKSDRITQIYIKNQPTAAKVEAFLDTVNFIGDLTGSVNILGSVNKNQSSILTFDDCKYDRNVIQTLQSTSGTQINDSDIRYALIQMTGSIRTVTNMINYDEISAGAGFTYTNCPIGTDSIAFGGLKR